MPLQSVEPFDENEVLAKLAGFLSARRQPITDLWLEAVRQDPLIGSADDPDDRALVGHLPTLFDDLTGFVGGEKFDGVAVPHSQANGKDHDPQDDDVPELTRELRALCRLVLKHGLDAFEDAHPAASRHALHRARELVLQFFEDAAAESVRRHVRTERERLAALNAQLRAADQSLAAAVHAERDQLRQVADAMPQIVWAARPDGHIDYFNQQWYEYTGEPRGKTGNEAWESILHPDDLEPVNAVWSAALASGEMYELEFRLKRGADGAYRWFLGRSLPVRDANGKIVRWIGTDTDIHDFKHLQERNGQLLASERAARAEAERTNRIKDEFLATLSHELRTPLNAILGWVHILGKNVTNPEDVAEGLAVIERNARGQATIIADLLDMSGIISGKVRLDTSPTDVAAVLAAALDTLRPAADGKGVRLETQIEPAAAPVSGDPNRLQQVFWNLIGNAIKFTPRGGSVRIILARVLSQWEISVIDSGAGIVPEFLPYVFDRFSQADASASRRHGGLGLGLAIVKQLVELHGGSVHVESAGVGQGAAFRVLLPVMRRQPGPGQEATGSMVPVVADAPASHRPESAILRGVKVLVVDDEEDSRVMMKRLLEARGATVRIADSAAEAMEVLQAQPPEVLLSDIGMPGEDGYSLIRRVRSLGSERGGALPAVAVTAFAGSEDRLKAVLAGFQMHVAKPIDAQELVAIVAGLAGRKEGAS